MKRNALCLSLLAATASLSACSADINAIDTSVNEVVGTWSTLGTTPNVVAMTAVGGRLIGANSDGTLQTHVLPYGTAGWTSLGAAFNGICTTNPITHLRLCTIAPKVVSLASNATTLYAYTDGNLVYSAPLSCITTPPSGGLNSCWTLMGRGPTVSTNPVTAMASLDGSLYVATKTSDGANLWRCSSANCAGAWTQVGYANNVVSMTADPATHLLFGVAASSGGLWWKRPTDTDWTRLSGASSFVGVGVQGAGGSATLYGVTATTSGTLNGYPFTFDSIVKALPLCDVAATCSARSATCGSITEPVCGAIACGSCASGRVCTGSNTCCTPTTCAAQGKNCGLMSNGCGGTLNCGSCSSPQSCGGGGVANVCGCTRLTCATAGKNCGTISDGCGGTLNCGSCGTGYTCSANVCVCTPRTFCFDCWMLCPDGTYCSAPHTVSASGCTESAARSSLTGASTLGCLAVGTSAVICR